MWNVCVYYDYLDPQSCEMMEYLLATETLAEDFRLEAVQVHEMIFVSPSFHYSISEAPSQHKNCFQTLEDAMNDLTMFVDRERRSEYTHLREIHLVSMDHLRFLIYRSECVYLEEENKMLRARLEKHEKHT